MSKLMQGEILKWHPDKVTRLFLNTEPNDADRMIVNMICGVVIELRNEANKKRKD